jgi:predicted ArsR family transcriptional regulator
MDDQSSIFDAPLPDPLRKRTAPVHRNAHETERAAARMVTPRIGTVAASVLVKHAVARDGMTDWELEDALGNHRSTVRTRRDELTKDGWIEDSGQFRSIPDTGNVAIVWRLTREGRAKLSPERGVA